MGLTYGSGPLTTKRPGSFNFDIDTVAPRHVIYLEDVPKRIRAEVDGVTVLDTRRAKVLYESNIMPQWYIPFSDVRTDLLTPTDTHTHCPFKGDASYWTLRVGDRELEDVVWSYPEPIETSVPLAGLAAFYFDRLDAWYEEDEKVAVHQRDPYHRVDTRQSSDHVVVRAGGETVAETTRPVKLFETSLPTRWYIPPDDVRTDLLVGSDTTSGCPYKGLATYRSLKGGAADIADAAWVYEEPLGEALQVAGYLSFMGEGIEVLVDGEPAPGT